ncbi:MAG: DUF1475 family protein [Planctomycetaceae bacterium]|nr:DUF1475 family protein [Planctomycetaceae bacterium]
MRKTLFLLFTLILVGMLAVTTRAFLQEGIFAQGAKLWPLWWFRATLADAYFGFLTFYAWVYYKESSALSRLGWLVLIGCLGNIAMAIYMLRRLWKLESDHPAELLLRPEHRQHPL